jgi:hypothetical protein
MTKKASFWFSSLDRFNGWIKLVGWNYSLWPTPFEGIAKQLEFAKHLQTIGCKTIVYDPEKKVEAGLQIEGFIEVLQGHVDGKRPEEEN